MEQEKQCSKKRKKYRIWFWLLLIMTLLFSIIKIEPTISSDYSATEKSCIYGFTLSAFGANHYFYMPATAGTIYSIYDYTKRILSILTASVFCILLYRYNCKTARRE